jgi:hypothetical protein
MPRLLTRIALAFALLMAGPWWVVGPVRPVRAATIAGPRHGGGPHHGHQQRRVGRHRAV